MADSWKVEVPITVHIEIKEQDVTDIMVTALEGGIGYWSCLDNRDDRWRNTPKGEAVSETAARLLVEGESIQLLDAETLEAFPPLTIQMLVDGIVKFLEEYSDRIDCLSSDSGLDCGMIDSCRADTIIQYALFGEEVYG